MIEMEEEGCESKFKQLFEQIQSGIQCELIEVTLYLFSFHWLCLVFSLLFYVDRESCDISGDPPCTAF